MVPTVLSLANRLLTGAHIPSECAIGRGTKIAYGGAGLVIHRDAKIGSNCLLSPGVVLGGRGDSHNGPTGNSVPVLEDNVMVYPGAKLLGGIRIGSGARIGPNAVVIHDVPPGATVVAPLGRILK